ncbi:anaphase-promoting complex subunit 5 [Culicoides brevitarsis]|uniref:anaphase-promoting complex subunit 5 n=1 Tax=Culicoides brevitarsis TaxID=469753 RepID=UPI00307BCD3F
MSNKKEGDNVSFWLPMAQSNTRGDTLTPHKISTIFLIQEFLEMKREAAEKKEEFPATYRKKFHLLLLKLIQHPDLPYRDFHCLLTSEQYGIHKAHLERFELIMQDISTSENGMEALFDLQTMIDKLMSEPPSKNGGVSQSGIVGLYLRRVHVTLDKMSFSEVLTLYKNIKKYYERDIRTLAIGPSIKLDDDEIGLVKNNNVDRVNQCKWSLKQAELFVSQQSELLLCDETRALPPKELQNKLCEIMQDNPLYSQAYFLCYLNSVRLRDYFNALDALKRAFDRNTLKGGSVADHKGYQYSSLNLAILHTQFGHASEAIQSLKECIMLAQENGDRVCLDLAQSWLSYFQEGKIQLPGNNVTSTDADKTSAINTSVAYQALVKKSALSGVLPAKLFEVLMRSDSLICQHSHMNLMAISRIERAALWNLYGKNELAACCNQVMLHTSLKRLGKTYNSDGICEAICSNALWLGLQGHYNLSATVLQHAKHRFPRFPLSRFWVITDCYLTSIQCIINGKWYEAEQACNNLYRLDRHLATLQRASLNIANRNLQMAQNLLEELLEEESLPPMVFAKAKLLMANTFVINSRKVLPQAIKLLSEALTEAKEKFLTYELAMIDAHFSYFLLAMNMPQRALNSLKVAIETVLVNGSLYDKARVTFLFCKCLIGACSDTEVKIKKISECLGLLEQASSDFLVLEAYAKAKDVYVYLAQLYDELDMKEERNCFAHKFRLLEQQYPTSSEYLDIFH